MRTIGVGDICNLGAFTTQYMETALWSSCGVDGVPLDEDFGLDDLDPELFDRMVEDCADFQNSSVWKIASTMGLWSESAGGQDFWLTRNRHGTGFWDRAAPGTIHQEFGARLSDAARSYGSVDLNVSEGVIYS